MEQDGAEMFQKAVDLLQVQLRQSSWWASCLRPGSSTILYNQKSGLLTWYRLIFSHVRLLFRSSMDGVSTSAIHHWSPSHQAHDQMHRIYCAAVGAMWQNGMRPCWQKAVLGAVSKFPALTSETLMLVTISITLRPVLGWWLHASVRNTSTSMAFPGVRVLVACIIPVCKSNSTLIIKGFLFLFDFAPQYLLLHPIKNLEAWSNIHLPSC